MLSVGQLPQVAENGEAVRLGQGMMVIACRAGESTDTIELAMGEAALTGFLAWLEAAPPGSYQRRAG